MAAEWMPPSLTLSLRLLGRSIERTNERAREQRIKKEKVNNTALPREDKFPQVTLGYGRGKGNNRQIDQCSGTWTLEMR